MIVDDRNVVRVTLDELEAHSPLVVYPNAPLSLAIAPQCLQSVGWGLSQILDLNGSIELGKSHCRPESYLWREAAGSAGCVEALRFGVGEGSNHAS